MPKFVDPAEVRRVFDYDGKTGRLVRKVAGRGEGRVGVLAGSVYPNGYRRTWFQNRIELTYRMVWAWHHGVSPDFPVAHENGDRADDRIENLRVKQELTKERQVSVTQSELLRLFKYEPTRGDLIRRTTTAHNAKAGAVAGNLRRDGYHGVNIGGRILLKHRLIWMYHYGAWPEGEIDHINRNRSDSRIENLRDVGRSTNNSNGPSRAEVGLKGVSRVGKRFFSRISLSQGQQKYLGTYDTPEQAHEVFKKAHVDRYGSHSEYFEGMTSGELGHFDP